MDGGNAFDAAVATSAAINVVEPMTNGVGGDLFAINYIAATREVTALNGSGRAPRGLTLDDLSTIDGGRMPQTGPHTVTVPGTVDGWSALLARHGSRPLRAVLEPAISLAREGFPVSEMMARGWQRATDNVRATAETFAAFTVDGRAPRAGEVFRNPDFADTLERIASNGRDEFYRGETATRIVRAVRSLGGTLALDDLLRHESEWVEPIHSDYRGYRIFECPPNGQGLAALLALNIVGCFDLPAWGHANADTVHAWIEAMKLAFADAREFVADPRMANVPVAELLSRDYTLRQAARVDMKRAARDVLAGRPFPGVDTEYHSVVDRWGNACSFICSLYMSGTFGSGIVPTRTGFALQNRGALFSLDPAHRNVFAPGKRPYHTIIPALALPLSSAEPYRVVSFGVMGGFMQPQAHLQVVSRLFDFEHNVQEALDAPRFQITHGAHVLMEPAFASELLDALRARGHEVELTTWWNGTFGRGQIVAHERDSGTIVAGSEPRSDGCAIGY